MAVTITRITHTPIPTWQVTRTCLTWAEAAQAAQCLDAIQSASFMPNGNEEIRETPTIPVMPDVLASDADDDMGLKAGEAHHPVSQSDED